MITDSVTVHLAYGEDGLDVEPARRPHDGRGADVRRGGGRPAPACCATPCARRSPGRRCASSSGPGQTVAISMCDGTRPQPRHLMIPAVLDELDGIVDLDDVVVLVATGTHRGNTDAEIRAMLGDEVGRPRAGGQPRRPRRLLAGLAGPARPTTCRSSSNRHWVEADVRITTGFVEPHFFAGFSGGPKMVAPGLAGLETVLTLHDARRIGDPRATWGVVRGQPGARRHPRRRRGRRRRRLRARRGAQPRAADRRGVRRLAVPRCTPRPARPRRRLAMQPVPALFDVVVTTNAGYPLDQNLYQAVKGMSAGMTVVKPGGTIVCAAECRDGFPDHGSYREVLASEPSPEALLATHRGPGAHGPRPVAGPGAGQDPGHADVVVRSSLPLRRRPRLGAPRPHRRRRRDRAAARCTTPGPTPGCACCPRARRRSRTSRPPRLNRSLALTSSDRAVTGAVLSSDRHLSTRPSVRRTTRTLLKAAP